MTLEELIEKWEVLAGEQRRLAKDFGLNICDPAMQGEISTERLCSLIASNSQLLDHVHFSKKSMTLYARFQVPGRAGRLTISD